MAKAKGISKAKGYLSRVFCVEYDLKGMIDAYGVEFMHTLVDMVAEGELDCREHVQRWSAHKALINDAQYSSWRASEFAREAQELDQLINAT